MLDWLLWDEGAENEVEDAGRLNVVADPEYCLG